MSDNLGGKTMKITVYHGGTERVDVPICRLGRENLDFGRGFYVTDIKEQLVVGLLQRLSDATPKPLLIFTNLIENLFWKRLVVRCSKLTIRNGWNLL